MKKNSVKIICSSSNQNLLLKFYSNILHQLINLKILTKISFKLTPKIKLFINKISLLKSPHVNKKAWTQYKQTIFMKSINIFFNNLDKTLYLDFFKTLIKKVPTHINLKITIF